MAEFVVEDTVKAKPETVFDVYLNHRGYANLIGLFRTAELEREGDRDPTASAQSGSSTSSARPCGKR